MAILKNWGLLQDPGLISGWLTWKIGEKKSWKIGKKLEKLENNIEKSRMRGYKTPVSVKGTVKVVKVFRGTNKVVAKWTFCDQNDISFITEYSLTTFVKEVFWLAEPVRLSKNENFVVWIAFAILTNPCLSTFF